LTGSLEKIARDPALGLSAAEREDLDRAIAVLSRVQHP
jgi:hypothetical protein